MAKSAYDKWREKNGLSGTPKTTNNSEKGKQSNSAPSARATPTNNTNSKSAYDKWREKNGLSTAKSSATNPTTTKQPTKKYTDFDTETKQAYTSAKGKANSKTTITSAISEEDRKKRIKDIDAEIRNLNYKIQGLSRGASYVKNDGRGYLTNQTEETKKKIEELSAERKSLERVGTFTASEMKQFEIEDAKAEKAKLPNYNPTARVSPSGVDAFVENAKAHYEADKKIDTLERGKALFNDIHKFGDVVNEDDFGGQWRSNYRFTELNEDAAKASSAYQDNPTPENREIALAYKAFVEAYAKNNEKALDDEGQVLPLLSDNFASHLAQQKGSAGKAIPLGLAGAGIGLLGGLNGVKAGWTAGYAVGSGLNTYDVVRGSLFMELLSYGVDEETAMKYAEDDAVVEALIESGETAKDWLFMLYGGIKGKAGGITSKATGKAARWASKYAAHPLVNLGLDIAKGTGLNAVTEYAEEGLQGAVSRGTRERAWATLDDETGQYGMGNIDLHNRPVYKNADGTISTVDSVTFEVDGKFVLLPTIVRDENGNAKRLVTNDEIIAHYVKTGEHLGMFDTVEEANGYATRLHYAQAYRYSDYTSTDADDNAVAGGVKVLADAIFGGNIEAREELHEQGKEGFKTGLVSGGVQGTAKFAISAFANAKTIKEQNEVADFIRNDKKTLTALIKEGKASGEGTVSAKLAREIEQARKSGKVTREQVKKLIASNETYKKAQEQASRNNVAEETADEISEEVWKRQNENPAQSVVNDIRSGMSKDDLRKKSNAAIIEREKVLNGASGRQVTDAEKKDAERLMKQYFLYKMASENPLQFMSQYGNKKQAGVTVADAQNATKFGDAGSVLVADFANKNNVSIEQAEGVIGTAYRAGLTGLDSNLVKFHNSLQRLAFQAGRNDRQAQDRIKQAIAKKASVYETGFTENEYSAKLTDDEREFFTVISKDLKMDTRFTDKIIADLVTGREANASHEDGKVRISNTSALAMLPVGIHEAFHRIRQLDPEASDAIMNFLYESSDQNARRMELGDNGVSVYELIRKDYGGNYDTIDYIEEIAAKRLQTLFKNPQEFLEWRAKLETNPQAKNGLQKLIEAIKEILEDMWAAITRSKMSLEAKRKAQAEIEQAKRLLAEAYIGAMEKADERASEINAQQETKTETTTDSGKKFSLIGIREDGIEVYETSKEVMQMSVKDRKKQYVRLMSNEYAGRTARFVRNGHIYYAEFDTNNLGKPMYGDTRSSDSGKKALTRMGADGDIFDLVENSTYSHSSVDTKGHKKTDYFDYFIKTVQIDNKVYDLLADVKKQYGENGGYVYTLILTDNEKIKAAPAKVVKNDSFKVAETTLTDDMVSQNPKSVKRQNSLKDSEGNTLTEEQAEYFKDSKVRDENGNLLLVHHGTPNDSFSVFDLDYAGTQGGTNLGYGHYFTDNKRDAKAYTQGIGGIKSGYLNIKNPIIAEEKNIAKALFDVVPPFITGRLEKRYGTIEEAVARYSKWTNGEVLAIFPRQTLLKPKDMAYLMKKLGFDGIISHTEYGNEYVAFESNQFKNTDNKKPTSHPDIHYSLKDSEGNTLTEAQAEFFIDSKVRDENGNLLVMYHGTSKGGFTQFDTYAYYSKFGLFGNGAYFTTSKDIAKEYTRKGRGNSPQVYAAYLNIANPIDMDAKADISAWNKAMQKTGEDFSLLDGDLTNEQAFRRMTEDLEYADVYSYDAAEIVRNIFEDMGYDGITHIGGGRARQSDGTRHRVFIAFEPEQIKDKENKNPTSHPDIHYSLKGDDVSKLSTEEQNAVKVLGKGAEAIINKDGEMLVATGKNKSTVVYSLKTYENGGKEVLEKALRENGHTEAEIKLTLSYVDDAADYLKILAAGYAKSHNYTALSDHLIADVITNVKTGKQVISSIVNNGEYPVNIDLALICKKRVAYMNLMNRLIDDGIFDKVNYGGEAIAKVNDLLRSDGFETACLGCFVESRRLQFQTWAETIVQEWNAEVDKRKSNAGSFNFAEGKAILTDAEMDALAEELKNAGKKNAQGNLNLGKGSVQTKMGRLLDKVPSLQKHLTVADLLKPEGLTALRAYDSNLFSIVKSRYGAASPKIVQDYNPYASEIAMMTFSSVKSITSNAVKGADAYRRKVISEMGGRPVKQKGETEKAFKERKAEFNTKVEDEAIRRYLYDIGGARIQSFSDFMIENVFDYIQIFADLSAKRLPLHGYTKEIIALRLFGMTGAKWNGSWIAHVDRAMGKEYAGLLPASEARDGNAILVHTDDGDYAIGFDDYARHKATNKKSFVQSIGMKDMLALQLDPRYSPYVGSITIGVSDKQILAMLDSPFFRFVIPYHSSGMLPQFAKLVGVDLYNDYTDYQNTTVNKWYDVYGNPCEPIRNKDNEIIKVDTSYNFNAEVQKTGDARKAADNYLKWCGQKHPVYDGKNRVGYVTFNPKFSNSPYGTDFTKHENYYKMLEDFNVYDSITEESAVQGAVTMNFPSEQNRLSAAEMEAYKARLRETGIFSEKEIEKYAAIADKTFKELIADEVKGRAEYQQAQSPKWENTVKNVEQMLLADHQRHSLKGGVDVSPQRTSEYLDAVEAVQKGKKGAAERLAKYVDEGMIRTEAYDKLVEKYGAIPKGEKPSREVQVPQKTSENKKVSQTVRTILEAKVTPDSAVPTIEKMVEDGVFSYDVYTDKQAIKDADSYIKEYGWDESLDDWFDAVEKGEVSKQITAMGWALYNNAANTASTTTSENERTSAVKTSLKILDAMIRHQRSAAQALQATRILKKLSPETQLYAVQKSVQSLQNELADKYGDKAPNLKVNEELAEQFINAKTPEERAKIEEEIYKDIGRQMPSRFIDKWNAWRYLAMLGNLRTHGRNIIGNAFFAPVVVAKDMTATAIESAVHRISGKKTVRGKSIIVGNKVDRMLLKAAWADYSNVADMVTNGGKYNDSALKNKHIEEGRQIFKFKPLEWARKKNSELLEVEDMWFAQPHYAFALAQYCKANNITAEQISKGRAIAPAREYAIKEAQKATYRDTNAFSQLMSEIGRRENRKNGLTKTVSAMIEGILPFRKTPANILVRGIEYSPIGLLKGLSYDLVQASKGKMSSSEVIDNISAGLTGTGLLALGVLLAAQGLVRGHGEDEDEKGFKELMGHQAYALELPNGQSMTLDWLAPEALPFFVGVNIWETTKGADEDANFSSILQSVSNITEPMLEMSCLQGVNDLLESIGYASSNDTSGLVSVLSSAATSYLSQIFPTLSGQAERTGEEYRMTTYTEKNSFLTGDMQYTLGKFSTKIPFWDYNQIPYIDAWGRKEASGAALKRGLNNFLNPAYTSTIETSKMEEELLRLFEQTGEGGVFPSRADKYFTVDGVRKDLTADEYVRYATLKGEKSYKLVSDLVKSSAYKKLSDTEKVKAVKEAYDYANQKAKQAISNYKPDKWVCEADKFGANIGNYISFRTEVSGTKAENGGKIAKEEVVDIILDMAQNNSEMWKMYLTTYDSEGDMYAYEKGVQGEDYMDFLLSLDKYDKPTKSGKYGTYTQEEVKKAISSMKGLSQKEKRALYQSVNTNWKNNPY